MSEELFVPTSLNTGRILEELSSEPQPADFAFAKRHGENGLDKKTTRSRDYDDAHDDLL